MPNDQQELESFLDSVMANGMQHWHVPGAVILLVQGNAVVFSKGYGYAGLEKQIQVRPDRTVFHMFSLSKLSTATAIMQLNALPRPEPENTALYGQTAALNNFTFVTLEQLRELTELEVRKGTRRRPRARKIKASYELQYSTGRWSKIERRIDHEQDWYFGAHGRRRNR